ncbi:unnamed protein product, partial [Mesorhabditis belari]|uniref:Uncharacterized protein n=1 Tax=Mesorhabditis belari TaxID=2138241 RepID=A0AAF3FTF0_9BILA
MGIFLGASRDQRSFEETAREEASTGIYLPTSFANASICRKKPEQKENTEHSTISAQRVQAMMCLSLANYWPLVKNHTNFSKHNSESFSDIRVNSIDILLRA